VHLNKAIMDRYRPDMKKYYYDPSKYKTYLEQLGIAYPTVRTAPVSAPGARQNP
jgi:aminobenzoyl-glutamate utilization protein B